MSDDTLTFQLEDERGPRHPVSALSADYWELAIAGGLNSSLEAGGATARIVWRVVDGYPYGALRPGTWAAFAKPKLRERWNSAYLPELYRAYADMDAADLNGPESADTWEEQWSAFIRLWQVHMDVGFAAQAAIDAFCEVYESLIGGAHLEALSLLAGSAETTRALEYALRELASAARAESEDALRLRSDPPERPVSPAFKAALERFMQDFGHRGHDGTDPAVAGWDEEPERLLAEIGRRLDEDAVTEADPLGAARDRADDARQILAKRPDDLARFDEALGIALRDGSLAEDHAHYIDLMLVRCVRQLALRAGRRLVRDGAIERADDIFHLRKAEVTAALREPSDLRPLVRERSDLVRDWSARRPPKRLGGSGQEKADTDDVVHGIAAAPGVGLGRVRIVRGFEDFARVEPDDVLVCVATNPSFTPLMAIAAAVVTETGTVHSHAAIESRELGVPCVVGIEGALDILTEGIVVEVDGTAGIVRIRR